MSTWRDRFSSVLFPNNNNRLVKKLFFPPLAFYSSMAGMQSHTHTHPTSSTSTAFVSKYKPLHDALKRFEVIPDVVDDFVPSVELKVSFPKGDAKEGNVFSASDLHYVEPDVKWSVPHNEKNSLFTLVCVDPDAPSRRDPSKREWRHWLVVNIPGSDIGKGEALTPYTGPHPPKDSGLHRYVFLLYKQPDQITPAALDNTGDNRGKFKTRQFAREYRLGSPVGAAFFQAEY